MKKDSQDWLILQLQNRLKQAQDARDHYSVRCDRYVALLNIVRDDAAKMRRDIDAMLDHPFINLSKQA